MGTKPDSFLRWQPDHDALRAGLLVLVSLFVAGCATRVPYSGTTDSLRDALFLKVVEDNPQGFAAHRSFFEPAGAFADSVNDLSFMLVEEDSYRMVYDVYDPAFPRPIGSVGNSVTYAADRLEIETTGSEAVFDCRMEAIRLFIQKTIAHMNASTLKGPPERNP